MIDRVDDISADAGLQIIKHTRRFNLVFDERIALAIGTQADALAQVVDSRQVLDPEPVHDVEHPDALEQAHLLVTQLDLLVVVSRLSQLHQVIDHLFAIGQRLDIFPAEVFRHRENALDLLAQTVHVPVAPITTQRVVGQLNEGFLHPLHNERLEVFLE